MTRLIDADALKEELRQYFTDGVLDGVSARLVFNQILHDIDNAPTVEPEKVAVANVTFDKEQLEEIVEKAKANVLAEVLGECKICKYYQPYYEQFTN